MQWCNRAELSARLVILTRFLYFCGYHSLLRTEFVIQRGKYGKPRGGNFMGFIVVGPSSCCDVRRTLRDTVSKTGSGGREYSVSMPRNCSGPSLRNKKRPVCENQRQRRRFFGGSAAVKSQLVSSFVCQPDWLYFFSSLSFPWFSSGLFRDERIVQVEGAGAQLSLRQLAGRARFSSQKRYRARDATKMRVLSARRSA